MNPHRSESRRQEGGEESGKKPHAPDTLRPGAEIQFSVASDVPAPELPEFKKKEKDKKSGGLYWQTASPGGGDALVRAASGGGWTSRFGLGRLAASIARRLGPQSFLGTLLLSKLRGWLLPAGIVAGATVLGVTAVLLSRTPAPKPVAWASPKLESPSSNIALNAPKDDSLSSLADANKGVVQFEEHAPAAAPPEAAEATLGATPEAKVPQSVAGVAAPQQPGRGGAPAAGVPNHGANQLTSKLGQFAQSNGTFGGAGPGPAKALNDGSQLKQPPALPGSDKGGKLSAFKKPLARRTYSAMTGKQGRADMAMGQLKMAKALSRSGVSASSTEGQKQFSTDAFEQQAMKGGEAAVPANDGVPQVVVPPGEGAPDGTTTPDPTAPDVPSAVDATPDYQQQNVMAKALAALSALLHMTATIMIAIGTALVAAGTAMMAASDPTGAMLWVGLSLVIAGGGLIAGGGALQATAEGVAAVTNLIGNQMQSEGQTSQGQIASETAWAQANGVPYVPPDMTKKLGNNAELQQKIDETRNATYNLDGGGGSGDGTKQQ